MWTGRSAIVHTSVIFEVCIFLALAVQSFAATSSEAPHSLFNVGYQVLDLKSNKSGEEGIITVAVWYPTAVQSKVHNYGGTTSGSVAVDAALFTKCGPYPLMVFSHGFGGSGLSSVFFTEQLAARGWIVVAPDHHDKHSAVRIRTGQERKFDRWGLLQYAKEIAASSPRDREKYLYRFDEMKLTLGRMLSHPSFSKFIDKEQIAVGGHSFGGFTALGLCGTIKERYDARIKAVLLFSTGAGGYLFTEDELQGVQIPSMLFLGEREKSQPRGAETMSKIAGKIFGRMSPPKYFLEVKGANHFSFNNRFKNTLLTRLMSGTEQQFDVICRYSIAFLETHVARRKKSNHVLKQTDSMLTHYEKELDSDRSQRDIILPIKESAERIVAPDARSSRR